MTKIQAVRLKFIDAFIGVHGVIAHEYIRDTFSVNQPTACADMARYRQINAGAPFDPHRGVSAASDSFVMAYFDTREAARHYLDVVSTVFSAPQPQCVPTDRKRGKK